MKAIHLYSVGVAMTFCGLPYALSQTSPETSGPTIPTNVPSVRAYVQPPAAFNPVNAPDEALQLYGYPPRPDALKEPAAFRAWSKALSTPQTRLVPQLEQTNLRHGPAQIQPPTRARSEAETHSHVTNVAYSNSTNWSGIAIHDNTTPFAKSYVYSEWIVPKAQQAFGVATGSWDWSSQWVGIDGWGSSDVLQAGTEADAFASGSTNVPYYAAWFEWFPNYETRISNFPVTAGDVMFVEVWNTSPTQGHAYLSNLSTNQTVSLAFSAPTGTTLFGNSMEWVVERPEVGGVLANLTNYTGCPFEFTYGSNYSIGYYPGVTLSTGSVYNITMINSAGQALSYCDVMGPESLWFYDAGPAR